MRQINFSTLLKGASIVGGVYFLMDLSYQFGKGRMLGRILAKNLTAEDMLNTLNDKNVDLNMRGKIVRFIANLEQEES